MSFKVGQRVVCIGKDDWLDQDMKPMEGPKEGDIETISGFEQDHPKFEKYGEHRAYRKQWFRPLNEQFAEQLLSEIEEEINEENLVPCES